MTASSGASFAGRHAAFEIVVGHELEVRAHLVGEVVIESAAKMQGSSEFRPPFAHGSPLRGQNAPHSFDEAQPSRFRGNELRSEERRVGKECRTLMLAERYEKKIVDEISVETIKT